jgi:flagellar biosynthesis/type III secretory pathway chaperone
MPLTLESDLSTLLSDLLATQGELLEILNRKRECLGSADIHGLAALDAEEGRLAGALQECLRRREELLARAGEEGRPSTSIQDLVTALPKAQTSPLRKQVDLASARARLLKHQSLTNWVIIQRTLLHLSQLLEIIATGGQLQPTYGDKGQSSSGGVLVDWAA